MAFGLRADPGESLGKQAGTVIGTGLFPEVPGAGFVGGQIGGAVGGLIGGGGPAHPSGQVGGIETPDFFKGLLPDTSGSVSPFGQNYVDIQFGFGQPFNVLQHRDAGAIANADTAVITEYINGLKPFVGTEVVADLDSLMAGFHNAPNFQELRARQSAALKAVDTLRGELVNELGEIGSNELKSFETTFKNTQQLRLLEREKAEIISSGFDLTGSTDLPDTFEIKKHRDLAKIYNDRLGELGTLIPELKGQGVPEEPRTGLASDVDVPRETDGIRIKLPRFQLPQLGLQSNISGRFGGGSPALIQQLPGGEGLFSGQQAVASRIEVPKQSRIREPVRFPVQGRGLL